jgi:hypothetical protein
LITIKRVSGENVYCVSERAQEVLATFPTLAQAATVQRFLLGANMSNDAMAFAVHCMQESEKRTEQVSALLWSDEVIKQDAAEDAGIGSARQPVKRRNRKKKKPAAEAQPAAVAPAGSGPAKGGGTGGTNSGTAAKG